MTEQQMTEYRQLLLARRGDLLTRYRTRAMLTQEELESREIEMVEQAQEMDDADRLAALSDADLRRVAAIDEALDRITQRSYGVCESCGEDIPVDRLRALPEATMCADCAGLAGRPRA
jgi:DnaK suppressor protein